MLFLVGFLRFPGTSGDEISRRIRISGPGTSRTTRTTGTTRTPRGGSGGSGGPYIALFGDQPSEVQCTPQALIETRWMEPRQLSDAAARGAERRPGVALPPLAARTPGVLQKRDHRLNRDHRNHPGGSGGSGGFGGPWPRNSDSTRNFIARTGWKS